MTYYIVTYGCQMNKADSERIAAYLERNKYKPSSTLERANLVVVNMCSVRQSAVDRVYGISQKLLQLKNKNPKLKTLLTGCILKKDLKNFKKYFDYILSIRSLYKWDEFLKAQHYIYYPNPRDEKFNKKWQIKYLKIEPKRTSSIQAFIPISWGCNNFCTFCVVPFTRGPEISRPAKDIIKEAKKAIRKEAKEVWLLGQNVNSYKYNLKSQKSKVKTTTQNSKLIDFPRLLKAVNDIEGDFWIRFTSSHPKDLSDELIETMAKCQKVTPYLNLPVQSGDNEILKKMNRPYTVKHYKNLIKKLRTAFKKHRQGLEKNIAISTDVIVGFPGETKKQFENTKKLFKEIGFFMAYTAQYSPRPNTPAIKMGDNVPQEEKARREKELTEIVKKSGLKFNKKFVGKIVNVLVLEKRKGYYFGKTRHYQTIKFPVGNKGLVGKFVKVKVKKALPFGLEGSREDGSR